MNARGADGVPVRITHIPPGSAIDPAVVAELAERLVHLQHRPPRLLTPLPRRGRVRLAAEHAVNAVAIWLACHDRAGAAERVWRICGMWKS